MYRVHTPKGTTCRHPELDSIPSPMVRASGTPTNNKLSSGVKLGGCKTPGIENTSRLHTYVCHCLRARAKPQPLKTKPSCLYSGIARFGLSPPLPLAPLSPSRIPGYPESRRLRSRSYDILLQSLLLVFPDTPSLVVPVRHDYRRRSQPVRQHADDAGPGTKLQNGLPSQAQL